MSFIRFASAPCIGIDARRAYLNTCLVSANRIRRATQWLAILAGAASLAACAQSSLVTGKSEFNAGPREARLERNRESRVAAAGRVTVARKHTPFKTAAHDAGPIASRGIASFYTEGTQTASGEKFDTNELTAAHPTLPFGTRLRVTNVATGKSVTVRVNDRGPYVPGRIVDVSYSAAAALDMVNNGTAKVKLDVVR
ncbi:septal ring lytic transglycosylase RlpA family protein [Bradyrhizobium sp. dw_78]|uniref:septal ring lytic transglycosylase RlpA family protein n=1 Tax=Bradyrhizobium sp. dw_78 TaxID=2719793 RepID=UPI001BD54AF7|nr:septal ring lytic transglycosylase RlpA family protein [Bradyrhizobium sp. dw_78]